MGAGRKKKTIKVSEKSAPLSPWTVNCRGTARNLVKSDIGGVIFGCKHSTIEECFSRQLFGLPAPHYSYVRNITPGLPLFLFNYSDRRLHGIFEASTHGQLNIDPYGWTADGSDSTLYPAQVKFRIKMQCHPLVEEQFRPIIVKNYYEQKLFWFELDKDQTKNLILLCSSSPIAPSTYLPSNTEKGNNSLSLLSNARGKDVTETSTANRGYLEEDFSQDFPHFISKRQNKDEEPSLARSYSAVVKNASTRSSEADVTLLLEEELVDKEHVDEELVEEEHVDEELVDCLSLCSGMTRMMLDEDSHGKNAETHIREVMVSEMKSSDLHSLVGKLLLDVEEFKSSQSMQDEKINSLEQKLIESRIEIQYLQDQYKLLESGSLPTVACFEDERSKVDKLKTVCGANFDELILIVGGSDGSSWLSAVDFYSPSEDLVKPLTSMNSVRACFSSATLNAELYIIGGAMHNLWCDSVEMYNPISNCWTSCPSLTRGKGSLAGISLGDKIFAIGGANEVECLSEVEVFYQDAGRWILTSSMIDKRLSPAAVEINGMLYVAGGYNGHGYLKSVETYDPRERAWRTLESMSTSRGSHSLVVLNEKLYALGGYDGDKMVPTVEVFDPCAGSWMMGEPMNYSKGSFGAVVIGDTIYTIGGQSDDGKTLDKVECYREGDGWQVTELKGIGRRFGFSALAIDD